MYCDVLQCDDGRMSNGAKRHTQYAAPVFWKLIFKSTFFYVFAFCLENKLTMAIS